MTDKRVNLIINGRFQGRGALGTAERALARVQRSVFSLQSAFGGIAFGALANRIVDATAAQERALAQLQQGIISTNGAVEQSFDDLVRKAAELQRVTTFGDEDIIAAQAQLVTFTQITGEEFNKTIELAADLSTRFGTDLRSSVIQLGKALNDPVANLSALSRSGIQFDESQKELIKTLVESGDLLSAQQIILAELETQFGGSARAARDTFGGAIKGLQNAFGDLLESDGGLNEVKDSIEDLTSLLQDPRTVQAAREFTGEIISGFTEVVQIAVQLRGAVRGFTVALTSEFQILLVNISEEMDKVMLALTAPWPDAILLINNFLVRAARSWTDIIAAPFVGLARLLGQGHLVDALDQFKDEVEDVFTFDVSDGVAAQIDDIAARAEAARQRIRDSAQETFDDIFNAPATLGGRQSGPARGAAAAPRTVVDQDAVASARASTQAAEDFLKVEESINDALQSRKLTLDEIQIKLDAGIITQAQAQTEIDAANRRVSDQLSENIAKGRELAQALAGGDQANAVGVLQNAEEQLRQFAVTSSQLADQINTDFATGLTGAFEGFVSGTESARDAFASFATDFIGRITQMIIQQQVLNALQSSGFGGGGGGIGGVIAGIFHDGGVSGAATRTRRVPAIAFAGAPRYHNGGIPGLGPNEMPIIAEQYEEILTRDDPRHRFNLGRGTGSGGRSVVNNNTYNIVTPNPETFRRTKSQLDNESAARASYAARRNS